MVGQLASFFKLRIGVVMMVTSMVAMVVARPSPTFVEALLLGLAVLVAAASAGAFNQYYEVDLDRVMKRTRDRPFVTGEFNKNPLWLILILFLLIASVAAAAWIFNIAAAVYIFLGAFFYAIVYTVWLKRRSWLNIVVGGASGSFAVLAGAAAIDPMVGPVPILLALVLFLWTPSHFWSLAIAKYEDYRRSSVPMLPVVIGKERTAKIVLANTIALVFISCLPVFYRLSWIYLGGALIGGLYFIYRNYQMLCDPVPPVALRSFLASLVQLIVLLAGAVMDVYFLG